MSLVTGDYEVGGGGGSDLLPTQLSQYLTSDQCNGPNIINIGIQSDVVCVLFTTSYLIMDNLHVICGAKL